MRNGVLVLNPFRQVPISLPDSISVISLSPFQQLRPLPSLSFFVAHGQFLCQITKGGLRSLSGRSCCGLG